MMVGKLTSIELRAQEDRSDQMDSSRNITVYLNQHHNYGEEYLIEGVRRKAQSWVETRKKLIFQKRLTFRKTEGYMIVSYMCSFSETHSSRKFVQVKYL